MRSVHCLLLATTLVCCLQCTGGLSQDQVQIGNQIWLKSPLKIDIDGSYCYDNDPLNCEKYGRMYAHKAAMTICTDGWHLPTDDEWQNLEQHLGMSEVYSDSIRIYRGDESITSSFDSYFDYAYGGMGRFSGKSYLGKDAFVGFWTASHGPSNKAFSIYRMFSKNEKGIYSDQAPKAELKYVLCVKDTSTPSLYDGK